MTRKSKIKVALIITAVLLLAVILLIIANRHLKKKGSTTGGFDSSLDFVQVMDVGQGDSILIYSNGKACVIDMGIPASADAISKDLKSCNIKDIDVVMISHLHNDHIGGLNDISGEFGIKNLIMPEILDKSINAAQRATEAVNSKGGKCYNAVQGMNFNIGEFELTVIASYSSTNENNRSLFAIAESDKVKFMFTGDAEKWAEKQLLKENLKLDCDVLKVSHHGSEGASSKEFLKAVSPEYAAISVGEGNMYSHPHLQTLESLKNIGARTYRTDQNGDIFFYVNDSEITVKTEKQAG